MLFFLHWCRTGCWNKPTECRYLLMTMAANGSCQYPYMIFQHSSWPLLCIFKRRSKGGIQWEFGAISIVYVDHRKGLRMFHIQTSLLWEIWTVHAYTGSHHSLVWTLESWFHQLNLQYWNHEHLSLFYLGYPIHCLWKSRLPSPVTICGVSRIDTSSSALACAVSNSRPKSYDSQWPSLLRILVSCLLRYRCLMVVQSKMCCGSFHSPSVTDRQMSCPIDKLMRLVLVHETWGVPPKITFRNLISSSGRSLDLIFMSSAVGGHGMGLVSLNARLIRLRSRSATSWVLSILASLLDNATASATVMLVLYTR